MTAGAPQWDVTHPDFLVTVLRAMVGLGIVADLISVLWFRPAFWGVFTGGLLAIALLLVALQAGRVFVRHKHFARIMLWLTGGQVLLWAIMALLIIVVKVDAAGFAFGVSILPIAIVVTTLYWWLIARKRMP